MVDDTGDQSDGGVDKSQRGDLSAREDEITERELARANQAEEALVDPFVVPAHDDESLERAKLLGRCMIEALAGW